MWRILLQVSKMAAVGEIAAGVAHELNQPLTAITNYAQACTRLLNQSPFDIEDIRMALRDIAAQSLRAGSIIRELRGLTRPTTQRTDTDLNVAITEVLELLRLIRNALEALEDVAESMREVSIATQLNEDGSVEMYIRDTGPGLPNSVLERMFDPFFSTKAIGTGLGLPISHTIVRAHEGTLTYKAVPSGGAVFRVRLPSAANPFH